jgi:F-type H+-transporting ATPase subunit beta
VLERSIAELGIYPVADPSPRRPARWRRVVGEEHYDVARRVQRVLQRFKDLQDIIAILGMDSCPRRQGHRLPGSQDPALPEPAAQLGTGVHRARAGRCRWRTPCALQEILDGLHDDVPEGNFYMKGGIEEIRQADSNGLHMAETLRLSRHPQAVVFRKTSTWSRSGRRGQMGVHPSTSR